MDKIAAVIVIIIILLLIFYYLIGIYKYNPLWFSSEISNEYGDIYYVSRETKNKHISGKILSLINEFNINFMEHMKNKYLQSINPSLNLAILHLLVHYNPDRIFEIEPDNSIGATSFTENKGEKLVYCIRSSDASYYEMNLLKFVSLHELSHIAMKDYGHNMKFWMIFKWFLTEAEQEGLIENVDYEQTPRTYCGMKIDYSPFFDNDILSYAKYDYYTNDLLS